MSRAPRILLLGKDGQIGWELQRSLAPLGEVIACGRGEADLARPDALRDLVLRLRPACVVNAAGYTAVDRAESEVEIAHAVNAVAPGILAEACEHIGAWLIHYSTDYVFDGTSTRPYAERDATGPLNVYGRTKLAGEEAIVAAAARHLVFRTEWVYGRHGGNFLKTMLKAATERDRLTVVADQHGAPTAAALIADVTAHALRMALAGQAAAGLYHLASSGATTWHAYARFVVERALAAGATLRATPDAVAPVLSSAYPAAARRPAHSLLDTGKLTRSFGLTLPDWRPGVARTVEELVAD